MSPLEEQDPPAQHQQVGSEDVEGVCGGAKIDDRLGGASGAVDGGYCEQLL
jgi:hypothetical protein